MSAFHCADIDAHLSSEQGAWRYGWWASPFCTLLWRTSLAPDETCYAQIGRIMLYSGNWVVLHFFRLCYFEKPNIGYWENAAVQWLVGSSTLSARLSCARGKLAPCILPCFPALALWVGYTLYALYLLHKSNVLRWSGVAVALGDCLD